MQKAAVHITTVSNCSVRTRFGSFAQMVGPKVKGLQDKPTQLKYQTVTLNKTSYLVISSLKKCKLNIIHNVSSVINKVSVQLNDSSSREMTYSKYLPSENCEQF